MPVAFIIRCRRFSTLHHGTPLRHRGVILQQIGALGESPRSGRKSN
jgi:hypothetical protein